MVAAASTTTLAMAGAPRFVIASLSLLFFLPILSLVHAEEEASFDVRHHLSTVTGYHTAKQVNGGEYSSPSVPVGCSAIHLNLVARHGTRAPTKKRIKELDRLAVRLHSLLGDAKNNLQEGTHSFQKIPDWLFGWKSPWKGRTKGGELIEKGEEELYHLGIRVRERFPDLFADEYNPDIYTIRTTQVPRASASAVAFGIGLFSGKGNLGPGHHRAFSVISESRASDICLRFFDTCETYKEYRKSQEPAVNKMKEPVLSQVTTELRNRYNLNFTMEDAASLWFLCKQEASILDITSQACSLFSPSEVSLLEWTDDLEGFILKGYGKSINYRMGVPLLQDVIQSIEQAIVAKEENHAPGTFEKARLRFAHAETLVPFSCLLGLFLEGSEFERIQKKQPLDLPPKPPQRRNWRGNNVAPFAGNNALILYSCPGDESNSTLLPSGHKNKYFVQILHNEVPVPLPGCDYKSFCPFEAFKERIAMPHMKHDFQSLCTKKTEAPCVNLTSSRSRSFACKLSNFFRWLFYLDDTTSSYSQIHEEL